MKTTIDHAGRVVIPKAMRELAGLKPGRELNVEYTDGRIEIEPARKALKWVRKGRFVVATAPPGTPVLTNEQVCQIIHDLRERRL